MEPNWIIGIQHVWFGISLFLLLLLLICRTSFFRQAITAKEFTRQQIGIFIILFSVIGLCGTYWNVRAGGGIINFRAVGIILGGFVGGPIVGTAVGTIVGIHRAFFINTDSSFIHGGLSIIQGIAAGFLSYRLKHHYHNLWFWSFLYAFILEFPSGFSSASSPGRPPRHIRCELLHLSLPVIATNTIAVSIFYLAIGILHPPYILRKTRYKEQLQCRHHTFLDTSRRIQSLSVARVTEIMTTSLPSLIWAAILYNDQIYTRTNYKDDADKNQGDAEIAILKLQHSLPDLPHLITLPVKYKGKVVGSIFAAKSKGDTFTNTGTEFLHGICHILESIYESEELKEEENLLAEAEIRALQAQINPHFLYNTLNTISYYVRSDPETARRLIQYLSDYFRHSLNNPSKLIPLSEELHVIECYTELETARFGDRLQIEYDFPKDKLDDIMVPPLLLQPLVENAVIHGIFKRPEGGQIKAGLIEHDDHYKIYVYDTGVGIARAKRRDSSAITNAATT